MGVNGGCGRNRTGVNGFAIRCMTTLPRSLNITSKSKKAAVKPRLFYLSGAENEIRTRDLNLGKVALYQLSYSRFEGLHYRQFIRYVKH